MKNLGSNETLAKIEADFYMYPTRTFDFGKSSVQVSAVP